MNERSELIASIRGEIVGPARTVKTPAQISFSKENIFSETDITGPVVWLPPGEPTHCEEVLYFENESPHRKYGTGVLHPIKTVFLSPEDSALVSSDIMGGDIDAEEIAQTQSEDSSNAGLEDSGDDLDLSGADFRHQSTIGISFCATLHEDSEVVISLPRSVRFFWQSEEDMPFPVNGRYEECKRQYSYGQVVRTSEAWKRYPAVLPEARVSIESKQIEHGKTITKKVPMPEDSPIALELKIYPRSIATNKEDWLFTIVLSNVSNENSKRAVLYQSYFEVTVENGYLKKYPESQRPFDQLDEEEQSLSLLYRDSAIWAIGHGCAAGWDVRPGEIPEKIFADVFPAVETPSMTPNIHDKDGNPVQLKMRDLADLGDFSPDNPGPGWKSMQKLLVLYGDWITQQEIKTKSLPVYFRNVAERNIRKCRSSLERIRSGIELLKKNKDLKKAFELANHAMLLQQIATKQLELRRWESKGKKNQANLSGEFISPWKIFLEKRENPSIGLWRAFQIAFLLLSLEGIADETSQDRETVDLIWFPTGGGKTEAYLGVIAVYMFYQRLLMKRDSEESPRRDGTNVLMRYTLRMLTTQQFQRGASLICAMERLRREYPTEIPGNRFSLGLWIGGEATPNTIKEAEREVRGIKKNKGKVIKNNPLVLTECPWCRAQIGYFDGTLIKGIKSSSEPILRCPDSDCDFGDVEERPDSWLPVEVIDERIYQKKPSLIIGTADKFAILAYRPEAGSIFGRMMKGREPCLKDNEPLWTHFPPGLIIQDELHLISGPLGTMYAFYETIFEKLCSFNDDKGNCIKPKLIASTATIRGASQQINALFNRSSFALFPSPGLSMADSFFGKYARNEDGSLAPGRLYLGIHAGGYGSILTAQVRVFSSALFRAHFFDDTRKDPWHSLLVFFNSIRELGGARTLFDSDIRSRLKFLFNREGAAENRRHLKIVEELTARLSQSEIVTMMDSLHVPYKDNDEKHNLNVIDVCLASNIIEVGVDIDRLSLMGVVGQPKTTAQYIQVTGRVGRKWQERPGLILMIYSPSKSRDRSHFEQFHSYHRRLYERVEPTSATPFAIPTIHRALPGTLIAWSRLQARGDVSNYSGYEKVLKEGLNFLKTRCCAILSRNSDEKKRAEVELDRTFEDLSDKWNRNPQEWEEFPPDPEGEYLILWPGQYATDSQKAKGVVVASSLRQVDGSAELEITKHYRLDKGAEK